MKHRIEITDEVYDYLNSMIEDEHIYNGDISREMNANGETVAHRPTFSEVIDHLIEDREDQINAQAKQIAALKAALISEKAMSLHWYRMAKEGETRDWEDYSAEEQESSLWYAEHRLTRELPEVDWNE